MNLYGIDSLKIIHFDAIDSTSTYLKDHYKDLDDMTLVSASYQSGGHGRLNRKWMATKGDAILFSILIKNTKIIKNFAKLSLLSANCVFLLLKRYFNNVSIKWPNDVYLNSKKVAGILLESKSCDGEIDSLVLGIGVNINNDILDEEIKNTATSLKLETGKSYDLETLKSELYQLLIDGFNAILNDDDSYLDNVRKNNFLKNKVVFANVNGELKEVEVIDINNDNSLKVKLNGEIINLSVGEITFQK